MKEKLLWSAVVLLSLALMLAHAQTPARADSQVGRYRIVSTAQDSTFGVLIFRLDTATGKTWMQVLALDGGAKKPRWAVMPDSPEQK